MLGDGEEQSGAKSNAGRLLPDRGVIVCAAEAATAAFSVVVLVEDVRVVKEDTALPQISLLVSNSRGGVRTKPTPSAGQIWRGPNDGAKALGVGASLCQGGEEGDEAWLQYHRSSLPLM